MRGTQFAILCLVAVAASALGGGIAFTLLEGWKAEREHQSASFRQLDVQALRIVDDAGNPRAGFIANGGDNGGAGLFFVSLEGKPTVELSDLSGIRAFRLYDASGVERISLSAANNLGQIAAYYGDDKSRKNTTLDGAIVAVFGSAGSSNMSDGGLQAFGGNSVASLKPGYLNLTCFGGSSVLANAADDGAAVEILDSSARLRAVVGTVTTVNKKTEAETKSAESQITLFNKDGNVIHSIP